ncbi:hypothetical protein PTKIN_Ptkin17bG0141900 [Pterospermum kingtungense]
MVGIARYMNVTLIVPLFDDGTYWNDNRLANNELPDEVQKLRCRVNYEAKRFTQPIEETGKRIVSLLRQKGPFLVLHLRYEKDVVAFTGCTQGLTKQEIQEVTEMRYSYKEWKRKNKMLEAGEHMVLEAGAHMVLVL